MAKTGRPAEIKGGVQSKVRFPETLFKELKEAASEDGVSFAKLIGTAAYKLIRRRKKAKSEARRRARIDPTRIEWWPEEP